MENAIQVSPETLETDDMAAFSFLSRAANAIVKASDLSRTLAAVREDFDAIRKARDTLEDTKAALEHEFDNTKVALANARELIGEQSERLRNREVELEHTHRDVTMLLDKLDRTERLLKGKTADFRDLHTEYNSMATRAADAEAKLAKMREIMGLAPEPKPEPIVAPSGAKEWTDFIEQVTESPPTVAVEPVESGPVHEEGNEPSAILEPDCPTTITHPFTCGKYEDISHDAQVTEVKHDNGGWDDTATYDADWPLASKV